MTTVTVEQPSEPEVSQSEPVADAVVEATEVAADSAVAIAEIEAARDVAIVETHAAVEVQRIEAAVEHVENETWLRERLASTETLLASAQTRIAELEAMRSEPLVSPAEIVETLTPEEIAEISSSIPSDTLEPTVETPTEASVESVNVEEAEVVIAAPVEQKRKPIIRLV